MRKEEFIMKKKLLTIFTLLGMLALVNSPLQVAAASDDSQIKIFIEGTSAEEDLEIPGYQIVSKNVDFNVSGTYEVTYQNHISKDIMKKTVYVVQPHQLQNQGLTISVSNQNLELNYKITNYLKLDDGSAIFVTRQSYEVGQDEYANLYITKMMDSKVVWNTTLMENIYGDVVQMIQDGNYIVGVGCRYFKYSSMDNFVFKIPLDGGDIKYGFFGGTSSDMPKAIVKSDNKYLIFGHTSSEKGELGGTRQKEDTYMMMVNYETLKYQSASYYAEASNDTCNGVVELNGSIYFLQSFYNEVGLPSNQVVKIDTKGEVIDKRLINSGYEAKAIKLVVKNGMLYILGAATNNGALNSIVYQIKENLESKIIDTYPYSTEYTNMQIADVMFDENGDLNILYNIIKNRDSGIVIRKVFRKDNYQKAHVIDYVDETSYNNASISIGHNGDINIINNNSYENVTMHHIRVKHFGNDTINNKNTIFNNYEIYFDGLRIYHDESLTNIDIDYSKFGKYLNRYYFSSPSMMLIYNREFNVLPNVSIQDYQKYDTFVKLTFNGEGLLNDQAITSGFQVKTPGEYELVVIGKDFAKVKYQFTIGEYSKRPTFSQGDPHLDIRLNNSIIKSDEEPISITCQVEESINPVKATNLNFLYLLMPITIGSALGFVIIKRG